MGSVGVLKIPHRNSWQRAVPVLTRSISQV